MLIVSVNLAEGLFLDAQTLASVFNGIRLSLEWLTARASNSQIFPVVGLLCPQNLMYNYFKYDCIPTPP